MQITEIQNMTYGMTFSEGLKNYKEKNDKSIFERIITVNTIEEDENLSIEEKNRLISILNSEMNPFEKRIRIMRALDREKEFSSKIAIVLQKRLGKMDMAESILKIFRDYYTNSDILKKDFGEVLTGFDTVKLMISEIEPEFWTSPYNNEGGIKRILETSNGSGIFLWYVICKLMYGLKNYKDSKINLEDDDYRYKFIIENMIFACELQKSKMFNWLCTTDLYDEYDLNVYCGSYLDVEFDIHMKEVWGIDKFTLTISNPPYQKSDGGGTGSSAIPIYNLFIEKTIKISDRLVFIIPSRWMAGGKGLDKFRKMMISSNRITFIKDIKNSDNIFKNTSISGGVCYFEWNNGHNDKCRFNDEVDLRDLAEYDVLLRDYMSIQILEKVLVKDINFLNEKVLSRNPYRITDVNNTGTIPTITKDGLKYTNNIVDRYNIIDKYKVLISKADGAAYAAGRIISKYKIAEPGVASTETYLVCSVFDDRKSAENFGDFLLTKFSRFMLSLRLISQNNSSDKFKWVPNFNDYSRPYSDTYLYEYFGLDDDEILFIENNIKTL